MTNKEEEPAAKAIEEPLKKEVLLRNLTVLPPRQHPTTTIDRHDVESSLAISLPPLRIEEAVASLRGALTEIVGYAHLTKFRLVLEKQQSSSLDGDNDAGADGNNKRRQAKGKKVTISDEEESLLDPVISKHTLKQAVVSVPPSVKTLEIEKQHAEGDTTFNLTADNTEVVLDEYGDLSVLADLLSDEIQKASSNSNNNNESSKIILDVKNKYAIRLVLERYDTAGVRDQIGRVRSLFAGNAPSLTSLLMEADLNNDDDVVENRNDNQGNDADGEMEEKKKGKEENGKDDKDKQSDVDEKKETPEEKATKAKQEAAAARQAIAKQLPVYPSNYDLTLSHATADGDYTHFYHYVCGEELALLANDGNSNNTVGKKQSKLVDDFMNDYELHNGTAHNGSGSNNHSKKNKGKNKKKNNNNNNGHHHANNTNGGKKKEDNTTTTNNNNDTTNTPSFSVAETEQILYTLNTQTIVDVTLRLSGYHSPPSHRRILGDLAYIECLIPGQPTIHVTAFPLGFYVNKTTTGNGTMFDPTPSASEPCYSHSLLDCLLQKSKVLRESWSMALRASAKRSELLKRVSLSEDAFAQLYRPAVSLWWNNNSGTSLGSGVGFSSPSTFTSRLDGITLRPSWLVPLPRTSGGNNGRVAETWRSFHNLHKWSVMRCEEELTQLYGMDVRGGGTRDWNEELQGARDMSVDTLEERLERARVIHKVLSDFSDAALLGVRAIFDGYISPMNPNEPARSHVYLHNNIFFSRAVDAGLDTFKIIQGDGAARKSANREARNVGVIHRLDVRGLYTLGTVLIDHLGTRFVCQSIVPGILNGDKAHTLAYGAVEALSELQCEEEMHTLLENSLGEECMVATRATLARPLSEERMEDIKQFKSSLPPSIINARDESNVQDDGEVKVNNICGPVEMKGIIGADKRKYVLDCARLTPRDANWVSKSNGGTGNWEEVDSSSSDLIPSNLDDDEWTAAVLRPELVTSYADEKLKGFLLARQAKEADKLAKANEAKKEDTDPSADASDKEQDGLDAKKLADEEAEADKELRKEEEEFVQTLRYNVNVFLPHVKSIENVDKDAYDKLQKDEEEARKLAIYLWNTVLPDVTNKLRMDNGKSQQIPVDGKSLTEFLHKRGINCRYLGRLADLARIEEQKDIDAEKAYEENKKENKLPRFRMALCWLELLECEMVARAAKHVLDSYLLENGSTAAVQPAQTIASLLSAVVSSVDEETAAETELRIAINGVDVIDADAMNALTLFDVGGNGDAVNKPVRGRADIWADIVKEVGRRFRYTLSLYNNNNTGNRTLYTPLLRRICQRSGIRIVAKKYDIGGKYVSGGGNTVAGGLNYTYPISSVDILDVLPLIKHAASTGEEGFSPCRFDANNTSSLHIVLADGKALNDAAIRCLNSGNISIAADYAQEAVSFYQRVIDSPLHVQIVKCIHLLSKCHFFVQDHDAAILSSLKYLALSVSLGGFDSMEALTAHSQLSDAYFAAGKVKEGIKHLRAAQFLMEYLGGGRYSQLAATYYKIGTQYIEGEKLQDALSFYSASQNKRSDDRMIDGICASSAAMAFAHLGKFSEASEEEKTAYQLYLTMLGEDHERTKISSSSLLQFMRYSLEQRKLATAQKTKLSKEMEADAIAASIKAEEDMEEAKKKQKKKKKKATGNKSNENASETPQPTPIAAS